MRRRLPIRRSTTTCKQGLFRVIPGRYSAGRPPQQPQRRGAYRMALFEREESDFGTDVATRALSVTAVENDFVERVYEKLASVYDLTFGPTLHPGRLVARDRMNIQAGH